VPSADRRVRRLPARGLDDAPGAGPGRAGDGGRQEAGEILGARPACREVGGDAGVALRRVLSGGGEVDVNVQDGHRLVAADVIERGARCAWLAGQPGRVDDADPGRLPLGDQPGPGVHVIRHASRVTLFLSLTTHSRSVIVSRVVHLSTGERGARCFS